MSPLCDACWVKNKEEIMTTVKDELSAMELKEILNQLPHRYPFLLVDRVLEVDVDGGVIHAVKNVSFNEPFFQGHFPGLPVMPGVLILEALAQAGAIWYKLKFDQPKISVLLGVNNAKFRRPVRPGDVLHLTGRLKHSGARAGKFESKAMVDGKVVCEAEITFGLADSDQL